MLKSLAIAGLFLTTSAATAQDGGWTYRASLYGWLPAMSTSLDTRFGTLEGEMSSNDVLSALDMALMANFSAQHGKWGVVGDLVYTDLSQSIDTPLPQFSKATVGVSLTAFSGYVLYRLSSDNSLQFDIGAGLRHFNMAIDAGLSAGLTPAVSVGLDGNWTDPLIAARLTVPFDDKWFLSGFADFGGTGAKDQSYQIYTGIGYNFDPNWSMQMGYRYMDIGNSLDGRNVNVGLGGVLLGVTYGF